MTNTNTADLFVVWCADDPTDPDFAWNAKVCRTEKEALAVRGLYAAQHPTNRYFITRGW